MSAFFLREILSKISYLQTDPNSDGDYTDVWIYTGGLVFISFAYMFIHPISYFLMYQGSYRLRIVLNMLIYDKVSLFFVNSLESEIQVLTRYQRSKNAGRQFQKIVFTSNYVYLIRCLK